MYKLLWIALIASFVSCKTTTYFVVRHAEKETTNTMTSDVPLSGAGKQRADALREMLRSENIRHIYSTNYIRTKSTAQPLADAIHVPAEVYDPRDTTFIPRIKSMNGNILIVGHSNTVDDLVNQLMGKKQMAGDLPDSEYGDLFVIKKKGNHYTFERKHFGN